MICSDCSYKLKYANASKLIDLNQLSPIGLLLGVSLAYSYCQNSGTNGTR